ncbi:CMRF35-like molecule 3 [Mauremys reevesii]|uniref:CMRF35-like molecule 3 n=1 Tax=Mauremys reevesii TaxID=260615 RepID=UPI00193F1560|nr:CMRF35-like molecule 3 [Mauremys reevesii]
MKIFPILGWMLFPGCWAVTGPGAVHGPAGGSVAVRCRYDWGDEDKPKFWCRDGGSWAGSWRCSKGLYIVETDGSEAEVRRGGVSIRDNRTQRAFTVTVGNLTPADAGTYHCGVVKKWEVDPTDTVTLTVSPATFSPLPTERSSSATANSSPNSTERSSSATSSATVQPASSTSISTSICTTAEEGKSSFSTNQDTTSLVAPQSNILLHILLPCVLLLLILFLLAAVMLVRVSKKRKKELSGASVQRDKNINLSNLVVENNAAGSSPEYVVIDSPTATDQTGFYSNAEILPNSVNSDCNYVEIQPHCQGSEEVSYVTVTISTPDQQPIYANVEQRRKTTRPAKPPEETLYSPVKQPTKH